MPRTRRDEDGGEEGGGRREEGEGRSEEGGKRREEGGARRENGRTGGLGEIDLLFCKSRLRGEALFFSIALAKVRLAAMDAVDGAPRDRVAARPAAPRGGRTKTRAAPVDSGSSVAAGMIGSCWCCGVPKELIKKYHNIFLCQDCWNGVRAKHRSFKKANTSEGGLALIGRDTEQMASDPESWRRSTLPFCELSTRRQAANDLTNEVDEQLRVQAQLFMQDKVGLTKKRFKSFHKFWDDEDSDACSDGFEEMLVEQKNMDLVPKVNKNDEDIVWVDDNMKLTNTEGTENRQGVMRTRETASSARSSEGAGAGRGRDGTGRDGTDTGYGGGSLLMKIVFGRILRRKTEGNQTSLRRNRPSRPMLGPSRPVPSRPYHAPSPSRPALAPTRLFGTKLTAFWNQVDGLSEPS